jgi:hypothetical protein
MRQLTHRLTCAVCLSVLAALLAVGPAAAHHSFTAEFTAEETATLTGVVTEVWFRNPHVRYVFTVTREDGERETWDARGSPVVWLARKGWTRDSIKVGDTVTFHGFLGRDGRRMLSIMTVTLEDGTKLIDRAPE